jgi:hypothetical protein
LPTFSFFIHIWEFKLLEMDVKYYFYYYSRFAYRLHLLVTYGPTHPKKNKKRFDNYFN